MVWLHSCVALSKVRSIVIPPQHGISCGRPSDEKLLAGYIRSVRVSTAWDATWILPENHLHEYFSLRVVVWLTVGGLGLTREAA